MARTIQTSEVIRLRVTSVSSEVPDDRKHHTMNYPRVFELFLSVVYFSNNCCTTTFIEEAFEGLATLCRLIISISAVLMRILQSPSLPCFSTSLNDSEH